MFQCPRRRGLSLQTPLRTIPTTARVVCRKFRRCRTKDVRTCLLTNALFWQIQIRLCAQRAPLQKPEDSLAYKTRVPWKSNAVPQHISRLSKPHATGALYHQNATPHMSEREGRRVRHQLLTWQNVDEARLSPDKAWQPLFGYSTHGARIKFTGGHDGQSFAKRQEGA